MIRKVLGLVALALLVAAPATSQSVDDIIAKNADAKGGLAKLKAVKSMRATGKMTIRARASRRRSCSSRSGQT